MKKLAAVVAISAALMTGTVSQANAFPWGVFAIGAVAGVFTLGLLAGSGGTRGGDFLPLK